MRSSSATLPIGHQRRHVLKFLSSPRRSTKIKLRINDLKFKVAGREVHFRNVGVSQRLVRRTMQGLFSFQPIVKLTDRERVFVKLFIRKSITRSIGTFSNLADKTNSNEREIAFSTEKGWHHVKENKRIKTLKKVLQNPGVYEQAYLYSPHLNKPISEYARRGIRNYESNGIAVTKMINAAISRKGVARVLDVGAGTNAMLGELKKEKGAQVETHSLRINDVPAYSVDRTHFAPAERMPRELAGKFDVITSNWCMEYSPLPNLVLENIAGALTQKGVAEVIFEPANGHGLFRDFFSHQNRQYLSEAEAFFNNYSKGEISTETNKILLEARTLDPTPADNRKLMIESYSLLGINPEWIAKREAAWCNVITFLRKSGRFKVDIIRSSSGLIGEIPSLLRIERLK